jgi:hypothetical protein
VVEAEARVAEVGAAVVVAMVAAEAAEGATGIETGTVSFLILHRTIAGILKR